MLKGWQEIREEIEREGTLTILMGVQGYPDPLHSGWYWICQRRYGCNSCKSPWRKTLSPSSCTSS